MEQSRGAGMTNADMILRLIQLHLPEFIYHGDMDAETDLEAAFCNGDRCRDLGDNDIDDQMCRECLHDWLEQEYDGRFTMENGRFVIREEEQS